MKQITQFFWKVLIKQILKQSREQSTGAIHAKQLVEKCE